MNVCIDDLTVNSRLVLLYVRDHPHSTGQEICDYLAISPTELADALAPLPGTRPPGHPIMSEHSAYEILRAYGCLAPTVAQQRAYVGVLDRMGAFASSEREILRREGFLASDSPAGQLSPAPDHHRPKTAR